MNDEELCSGSRLSSQWPFFDFGLGLPTRGISLPTGLAEAAAALGLMLIRLYAEQHTGDGITGTAADVADLMGEWFETRVADGVIPMPPTLPTSLADFAEAVVPAPRRRGLFREDDEGRTSRENLGVPRPSRRP